MIILHIPHYSYEKWPHYSDFHLMLIGNIVYLGNYKFYINLTEVFRK